jgi:valyl-tRNA synthetase
MPFVTEELWQRLNRRSGDVCTSITKAKFPVEDKTYSNEEADKEFDIVFAIIKATRSLMVEYSISKNAKGNVRFAFQWACNAAWMTNSACTSSICSNYQLTVGEYSEG